MKSSVITNISTRDVRFPLEPGEGADAVHSTPVYSYAVTVLETQEGLEGIGLAFTLVAGNELVCRAMDALAKPLVGREIEGVMAEFGAIFHQIAEHPNYRWLGPHKGVVHLALASITNACFDLWAKSRNVPLWKLLLDLAPDQIVALLDLSYLEDVLNQEDALSILHAQWGSRHKRAGVITEGYPGYDTSVGWFHYPDDQIRLNAKKAVQEGFTAVKLKVGSDDASRDIRRAHIVREAVGDDVQIMLDANQQWNLPKAIRVCLELSKMSPYWIEEPTHPDDVLAFQTLARAIAPIPIATGEHLPNRIQFKNYLQAGAVHFVQADAVRVGGISEFIAISLMAKKFNKPVIPHVGDMGQIHQHLVLFNHIAMGHEKLFLEYIPHLRKHFIHPAKVEGGVYHTPQEPGNSSDLNESDL